MGLYKSKLNHFPSKLQLVPSGTILLFKDTVASEVNLPTVGNTVNDARITSDTGHYYIWNGTTWVDQGDLINLEWSAIDGKPASTPAQIDYTVSEIDKKAGKATVTVGISGADYDNFDDAIDYLRTLNGGKIIITSDMMVNCASDKDISHIEFVGLTGRTSINLIPGILTGKWYGSMVKFNSLVFLWSFGSTQLLEVNADDGEFYFTNCMILGAVGKELIDAQSHDLSIFLQWTGCVEIVKNSSNVVVQGIYNALCQNTSLLGTWVYDSSSYLIGTASGYQILDRNDRDNNLSAVSGTTTKDALNTLNTNKTTLFAVKTDVDIADALTKKHTQNTDTILDNGGNSQIESQEIIQSLTNIALLAIQRAKDNFLSYYRIIQGIVDGYIDESGIDTVNSINQVYDASGDFYTNNSSSHGPDITTSGQAISSSDLGGYPKAQAFDKNSGTLWACNDYYLSGIAENAYIGQDFGVNRTIRRFTLLQSDSSNRIKDAYWEYSDNGSDWTIVQIFVDMTDSSSVITYDTNDGGSHRYWRLRVKAMYIPSTTSWNVHEMQMMEGAGANNMSLISEDFVLSNIPSEVRLFLDIEEVSVLTINTDIKISVSRDGGVTWTEGTIFDIGKYDMNKHFYMIRTNISSQPSNSIFKYKIETFNNKEVKTYGVCSNTK